jgi:hypothetical protein
MKKLFELLNILVCVQSLLVAAVLGASINAAAQSEDQQFRLERYRKEKIAFLEKLKKYIENDFTDEKYFSEHFGGRIERILAPYKANRLVDASWPINTATWFYASENSPYGKKDRFLLVLMGEEDEVKSKYTPAPCIAADDVLLVFSTKGWSHSDSRRLDIHSWRVSREYTYKKSEILSVVIETSPVGCAGRFSVSFY